MIEYRFKTVGELKKVLSQYPDEAIIDIGELPENIEVDGLTAIFDGNSVLICQYHDY